MVQQGDDAVCENADRGCAGSSSEKMQEDTNMNEIAFSMIQPRALVPSWQYHRYIHRQTPGQLTGQFQNLCRDPNY